MNDVKRNKIWLLIVLIICILIGGILFVINSLKDDKDVVNSGSNYLKYNIKDNDINDFDLGIIKLENNKKNVIYSPLAIKYSLGMLNEGANGKTKKEISDILGNYSFKKYKNSSNMMMANALFVKDTFKDEVNEKYINKLKSDYNASVIYDQFRSPDLLNKWVSENTFGLVDNVFDNVSNFDFILSNTLAIDMEWVNKIQSVNKDYYINYEHRDYSFSVMPLGLGGYGSIKFDGVDYDVSVMEIGAVANRYDIISEVGEDNIRKTVSKGYQEWLNEGICCGDCSIEEDVSTYVNRYIKEISNGYNEVSSSTDFMFYVNDNVKVFAKDLKEYDDTQLQYIGIMPIKEELDNYVNNINANDIKNLISNLKSIQLDSFKDGVITEVHGSVPLFNFDYEIDLVKDLKQVGIKDVFNNDKSDLTNLAKNDAFISKVVHKSNISFTNDGIKAAAAVVAGGAGAANCGYDYIYEVPVLKIDLTFNKPFLFIIRDKETGEVWFSGTVYEPDEYDESKIYSNYE